MVKAFGHRRVRIVDAMVLRRAGPKACSGGLRKKPPPSACASGLCCLDRHPAGDGAGFDKTPAAAAVMNHAAAACERGAGWTDREDFCTSRRRHANRRSEIGSASLQYGGRQYVETYVGTVTLKK